MQGVILFPPRFRCADILLRDCNVENVMWFGGYISDRGWVVLTGDWVQIGNRDIEMKNFRHFRVEKNLISNLQLMEEGVHVREFLKYFVICFWNFIPTGLRGLTAQIRFSDCARPREQVRARVSKRPKTHRLPVSCTTNAERSVGAEIAK